MRMHHVNYRTRDPRPVVDFYRAFGFEVFGGADMGTFHTVYLRAPGDTVCMELTVDPNGDDAWVGVAGTGHLALAVADLPATVAALGERGIEPSVAPFHPGDREHLLVCFYVDPAGNKLELMHGDFVPPRESLPFDLSYD